MRGEEASTTALLSSTMTGVSRSLFRGRPAMSDAYALLRPLLFRLPAESANDLARWAIAVGLDRLLLDSVPPPAPSVLSQRLWGLEFPNPIGLAAGFDKNARVADMVQRWGFGFVEIGTVTPRPQPGNPRPRLFRLAEDRAIVNRMGFNSEGLERVAGRLQRLAKGESNPRATLATRGGERVQKGILGVNLGANRDSADAATDYEAGIRGTAGLADYLVVNVSSPNTPGLRDLQGRTRLEALLHRLIAARDATGRRTPLLLKIAPDLTPSERRDIAEVASATGIDGLVVANTTVARPAGLSSRNAAETGGLSGRPLLAPSTALLADMYRLTEGRLPLIGVGGIADAGDAYAKIRAGASLVQLYTALVFSGPALVGRIGHGLAGLLRADGFGSIAEAVGAAFRPGAQPPPASAAVIA
jgi:dihydroorotate dehydrogenase